jgi:predicted nucleic acid-binding protein
MTAVTDTSPVCYLTLIGKVDLLRELFSNVLVPRAVVAEPLHEDAPESVRALAANIPSWISVNDNPVGRAAGMEKLQAGEQNVILLAETVEADIVLLDEKSARRVAAERGLRLRVTGTLGVLGEAATRGLADLIGAIELLRKTNFRYSPALLKAALDLRPEIVADADQQVECFQPCV